MEGGSVLLHAQVNLVCSNVVQNRLCLTHQAQVVEDLPIEGGEIGRSLEAADCRDKLGLAF